MTLQPNSLLFRIVIFHIAAIIVAAITVPIANYLVINRSANQFEAQTLRAHAAAIGQYLHRGSRGVWQLDLPEDLRALYTHDLDGLSYQVRDGNGHTLFASKPNDRTKVFPAYGNALLHISRNGTELYGLAIAHGSGPNAVQIAVAQNVQHPDVIFDDIVSDYLARIEWLTVAILAILLIVDVVIVRHALLPILHASDVASAIDPAKPDLRLPIKDVPQELRPLIVAMNEALARLERGILLQREFTADAAHELRTPLTVLRARIETYPDPNVLIVLNDDLKVMESVISQLLDMAEIENPTIDFSGRYDLHEICADVATMLADIAFDQGKELALAESDAPVWVRGYRPLLFQAVRNLVDNAIRYTPPNSVVDISAAPKGIVTVKDRGPGIPVADRELVFQRFWRANREKSDGAGLGLTIVSRIAEMHGAKVTITERPNGGAAISIAFISAEP